MQQEMPSLWKTFGTDRLAFAAVLCPFFFTCTSSLMYVLPVLFARLKDHLELSQTELGLCASAVYVGTGTITFTNSLLIGRYKNGVGLAISHFICGIL